MKELQQKEGYYIVQGPLKRLKKNREPDEDLFVWQEGWLCSLFGTGNLIYAIKKGTNLARDNGLEKPINRFFIHEKGFEDGTVYLEWGGEKMYLISKKEAKFGLTFALESLEFDWKEVIDRPEIL